MTKKRTLISLSIFVLFIMIIIMIFHNYSLIKEIKKPEPPNRQIINENIATNRQNAITKIIEECSPTIVGIHVHEYKNTLKVILLMIHSLIIFSHHGSIMKK